MDFELKDIKDVASIAKPFIDPIITTILSPQIAKLEEWVKGEKEKETIESKIVVERFENYLARAYKKFSCLNILVFPNQQIDIKEIYYPLTLESSKDRQNYTIDSFNSEILTTYERILIADSAGMGKSTLLKWIGLNLIEQVSSIPILIELKRLKKDNTIIDEIFNQICPLDADLDKDILYKFIEFGNFTILLDGFDEIISEQRNNVIDDLKNFTAKSDRNHFILTSRKDESLSSFGDFQLFTIRPLEINEAFSLIDKYDKVGKFNVGHQLKNDITDKLSQVKEFLTNPFLVSLLYRTYTYNKDIPSKKSTFYDEVYAALYKHHDLSKDHFERNKASGLDLYDFRIVLRQLAFDTAKLGTVEYTTSEILQFITLAKKTTAINFKEASFLHDLENNVPLFVKDGVLIKWGHKSLQDYFAAEWISNSSKKEEVIHAIYASQKRNYLNILDFIYELEPKVFRKKIIYDIVCKYIDYCESSYKEITGVSATNIAIRQAITFGYAYVISDKPFGEWEEAQEEFINDLTQTNLNNKGVTLSFIYYGGMAEMTEWIGLTFSQEIVLQLRTKNEDIFMDLKKPKRASTTSPSLALDTTQQYLLNNDKTENHLNSQELFDKINNYLLSTLSPLRDAYFLDYKKCLKYKSKVLNEIAIDMSSNVFEGL